MASTPVKASPRATNENGGTPVQPWSRSKQDRFAGIGSLYKPTAAQHIAPLSPSRANGASPRFGRTPKKSPAVTERYATPAERLGTPVKPKPSPAYRSATDRFDLPGALHRNYAGKLPDGPHATSYTPSELKARVRGAVKLQAAIRRRQSNLYRTPGVGDYDIAPKPAAGASGGSAVFKSTESRFEPGRSIYKKPVADDLSAELPDIPNFSEEIAEKIAEGKRARQIK
jgi:hypothetical protein